MTRRTSSPPVTPAARRLAWLDALRGFAALFVVFDHLSYYVLQHVRADVYQYFDPGLYGVFVFFMVSGYIVPASLERKGSIRGFWVSRVFRLYPLYLVALVAAVVLWQVHLGLIANTNNDVQTALLTHALMLSNVLGTQNAINVIWTLSYEMAFYLLVTALFVTGKHQRSSRWALLFAVTALAPVVRRHAPGRVPAVADLGRGSGPDLRRRPGLAQQEGAGRVRLARAGQLLGLPAASTDGRGVPTALDHPGTASVAPAAPDGRGVPGHTAGPVLAVPPLRGVTYAAPGAPRGRLARNLVRPRHPPREPRRLVPNAHPVPRGHPSRPTSPSHEPPSSQESSETAAA